MADDRAEEIFKAIKARNSVLLDELFENMTSSERANVLGSGHYGSGEFPYEDAPLAKAADNEDLASVEVLLKYRADIEVREDHLRDVWFIIIRTALFSAAVYGGIHILRCLIENGADVNGVSEDDKSTPLMNAAGNSQRDVVTFLIEHGANVDLQDEDGFTALHYACFDSAYIDVGEMLGCLIENGADVNARTNEDCTPLMIACDNDHVYAVKFLMEHGANVDHQDRDGRTAVHHAVNRNAYQCLSYLTENGADVDHQDRDGRTAVHHAVNSNAYQCLRYLTENGADVNARTYDGRTPLMIATARGHIKIAMYLIDHGAEVHDRRAALHNALHCSCTDPSSCEILSCMIENGGDFKAKTFGNRTPLMTAAEKGQIKVVTYLIERGVRSTSITTSDYVNLRDDNGQTALHHAVQCFDPISCEILSCLIEHGGDVNCSTYKNRHTPLMIAAQTGQMKLVTFLIEHGANLDRRDKDDQTALHYAVCGSDVSCKILSYLIENGAEVNAFARRDNTPLMLACKYGHLNAVSSLIEHGAKVNLQDAIGNTAVHYALSCSNGSPEVLSRLMRDRAAVNSACTRYNSTPLMIACQYGHMNAVTFLIEHGANMDLQDQDGNTALHYAVNAGAVDTLLDLGALHLIPVCNKHGLTPLLQASNRRNSEKVKCLIQRPEITKEQKIEALELLGASIITECDPGIERGFDYIKNGMEERFANPSQPLLKQQMEPVKAYLNRKECQTLEELAKIEGDVVAIVMESLYIRGRILGKGHAKFQLLYQISHVASCYLRNNDLSTCIRLRRHAMKIAQSSNVSSAPDFRFMTSYMNNLLRSGHPEQKDVLDIFEQTVLEYQFNWKIKRDFVDSDLMQDLFLLSVKLISFISKFRFLGETNTSKALVLLRKLCRQDPRDELGNTLLHEIVFYEMRHFWSSFPVFDALKLLLEAGGCDVNAVNNKGNTPLHLAVTLEPSNEWVHIFTNMSKVLFDGGAHHDFVNNDGKTPMAIAQTDEARMILSSEKRKLELKCISARAVKKFGIPYSGVVPKTLEKYISMH